MATQQGRGKEFLCKQCNCAFRHRPSSKRVFCSLACYNLWISAPPEVRFFRHLSEPTETGCILWTATRNGFGYGVLHTKASRDGRRILAHRLAWIANNGPIPDGTFILHKCDNPQCVNIDHLFLGTRADNNADARNKGRMARGERCNRSHLTDADIVSIRKLWNDGKHSQYAIASMFGVGQQTVWKIIHRRSWSHV